MRESCSSEPAGSPILLAFIRGSDDAVDLGSCGDGTNVLYRREARLPRLSVRRQCRALLEHRDRLPADDPHLPAERRDNDTRPRHTGEETPKLTTKPTFLAMARPLRTSPDRSGRFVTPDVFRGPAFPKNNSPRACGRVDAGTSPTGRTDLSSRPDSRTSDASGCREMLRVFRPAFARMASPAPIPPACAACG